MTFEFPSILKDNIQLNFQNGKLTVSAETKKSEEHVDNGYTSHKLVLPWFSLVQLGLALLTSALVPLMESSQAIKALAGLCQLQLAYDLAMVLFIIHI